MIQISNLNFSYKKNQQLFDHLDLIVGEGKICGLLGKNGSGKTTLLRQILGLLFPQEGEVNLFAKPAKNRNPEILKQVYYVQEEFELPSVKVKLFEKLYSPFYDLFEREKFYSLLDTFEVNPAKNCNQLSFGQKKKVQIAFALSSGVRLLLLDEPTNGLDIPSKTQFRKVVISSLDEHQSVIISSHQVRDLHNLLDQVIILENGKIILNEDIHTIGEVLHFSQTIGSDIPENVLYKEMIPGGYSFVKARTDEDVTQVELEGLFNAVVMNTDLILELFNTKKIQAK